jgi:hypothetical protein
VYDLGLNQGGNFAFLGIDGSGSSPLVQMLMGEAILPGSELSYQLCKTIHSYHPLGALLTDGPITLAQSQPRILKCSVLGEGAILEQFQNTFDSISKIGGTSVIHNLLKTSRMYGISSLGVGEIGRDPATAFDINDIGDRDLYFNVFDPLNTAGSLVLNQNPNSPDFLKPGRVEVNGQVWHPSRIHIKMHEQPIYIEYTGSAFGFVGRSVYQRALYPLKTFLQTMITDQWVTLKAGLLVAKMETPSSFIDNLMQKFAVGKRVAIKNGVTSQVLQIGLEEEIETLNMMNLDKAAGFARENVLKNIAAACGMPATLISQETMSSEMHEGAEDAKKEAQYLDYVRQDAQPAYDFMDRIVMRKAWTPEFFETLLERYPEYRSKGYEVAVHEWIRAFTTTWPNLLTEPDSEKSKTADVKFKAVVAAVEVLAPEMDPENKANLIEWVADNINEAEALFSGKLVIDRDKLEDFLSENREAQMEATEEQKEPGKPRPFAAAS